MPSCPDAEKLVELAYGDASDVERAELESHVETCGACAETLGEFRSARRAFSSLEEAEPPAAARTALLREAARAEHVAGAEVGSDAGSLSESGAGPSAPARAPGTGGAEHKKPARAGFWNWVAGVFEPIAQHPALAAAATIVMILGVAGALRLQGGPGAAEDIAQPSAPEPEAEALVEGSAAEAEEDSARDGERALEEARAGDEARAEADEDDVAMGGPSEDEAPVRPEGEVDMRGDRSGDYQVAEAESEDPEPSARQGGAAKAEPEESEDDALPPLLGEGDVAGGGRGGIEDPPDPPEPPADDGAEREVMEMERARQAERAERSQSARDESEERAAEREPRSAPAEPARGGAARAETDREDDAAEAPASAEAEGEDAADEADEEADDEARARRAEARERLIAAARAEDCERAAELAADLREREPSYYEEEVEGVEALESCAGAIERERERRAREDDAD